MTGFDARREQASEGRDGRAQPGRRRTGFALAATLSGFMAMAAFPTHAQAQIFGMFGWSMPPGQVMRMIQSRGFRPAGPFYRNGRVYVADVTDERGVRQRLIVDAFSGEVLQAFVLGRPSETYGGERSARVDPLDRDAPQLAAPQTGAPQEIESQPIRPKPRARTSVSKREIVRAHPEPDARAPSSTLPPSEATRVPAPLQSGEPAAKGEPARPEASVNETLPAKSQPAEPVAAEPAPAPAKAPVVEAPKQQAKAPAVPEMPVAPLDDAIKKPNHSATDVPVAPLD